jgi:hypothetical protein
LFDAAETLRGFSAPLDFPQLWQAEARQKVSGADMHEPFMHFLPR